MHIFWNWENNIWSNKVGIVAKKDKLLKITDSIEFLCQDWFWKELFSLQNLEMKKKKKTIRNDVQQWLYVKDQPWIFNKKKYEEWWCIFGKGEKKKSSFVLVDLRNVHNLQVESYVLFGGKF